MIILKCHAFSFDASQISTKDSTNLLLQSESQKWHAKQPSYKEDITRSVTFDEELLFQIYFYFP